MQQTIRVTTNDERYALITDVAFANVPHWYGKTRRNLYMDLITLINAGGSPRPCVLFFCGGAYMTVSHSLWLLELYYYAQNGFIAATAEYRTSNEAQFPAQLIDVKSAVRYLKAHAAEYGIDPDRIFIMGESAGGTLASLAGATSKDTQYDIGDNLEFSSSVCGVIDYYGQTLLTDDSCIINGDKIPDWTMRAFVGENMEFAAEASVLNHIDADTPPFMIIHGTVDQIVPLAQSEMLYEKLTASGVQTEFLKVENAIHGDGILYQPEVRKRILAFMKQIMAKQ